MSLTRIYQPISLAINTFLRLDEQASHHVARVLRLKEGDEIAVFNGDGGEFCAIITQVAKKNVDVEIKNFLSRNMESPLNICLAQGIARGEKMDWIIQKAVELGVKKIVPLLTERCNVQLNHERIQKRIEHWQSVIISACEQSGRNVVPEIVVPQPLDKWLFQNKADIRIVLSPHATKKSLPEKIESTQSISILIGPEGGLSEQEIKKATLKKFIPMQLGPRILRTETAPIAALAILQSRYGDFCN